MGLLTRNRLFELKRFGESKHWYLPHFSGDIPLKTNLNKSSALIMTSQITSKQQKLLTESATVSIIFLMLQIDEDDSGFLNILLPL